MAFQAHLVGNFQTSWSDFVKPELVINNKQCLSPLHTTTQKWMTNDNKSTDDNLLQATCCGPLHMYDT